MARRVLVGGMDTNQRLVVSQGRAPDSGVSSAEGDRRGHLDLSPSEALEPIWLGRGQLPRRIAKGIHSPLHYQHMDTRRLLIWSSQDSPRQADERAEDVASLLTDELVLKAAVRWLNESELAGKGKSVSEVLEGSPCTCAGASSPGQESCAHNQLTQPDFCPTKRRQSAHFSSSTLSLISKHTHHPFYFVLMQTATPQGGGVRKSCRRGTKGAQLARVRNGE